MPPKKRGNGYQMPDPIPPGEILEDSAHKEWKLGPSIGKGGFGEIYSAQEVSKSNQYNYVVKIEPHTNGPLFVEMNFLIRNAKKEDIDAFKQEKKLKSLGMPVYISSGSHQFNKEKYRFIVLEKFGTDIWKLFLENKEFPIVTVLKIASQILDVLQYIHNKGYVHSDIKGANILLSLNDENQVYLVDFGLASRYFTGKEYKRDPKKAHNGTLEYVSCDGHNGVQTRRGDLETLGYNLIQWLGCVLPWNNNKNAPEVHKIKEEYINNIPDFMKACFKDKNPPKAIIEYFIYLTNLKFDTEPDYKKLQKILTNGIDSNGGSIKSPLVFTKSKTPVKRKLNSETPSSGAKPKLPRRKLVNFEVNDELNGEEKEKNGVKKRVIKKGKTVKGKNVELNEEKNVENIELNEEKNVDTSEMKRIKKEIEMKTKISKKPTERKKKVTEDKSNIAEENLEKVPKTRKVKKDENVNKNIINGNDGEEIDQKVIPKTKRLKNQKDLEENKLSNKHLEENIEESEINTKENVEELGRSKRIRKPVKYFEK